MDISMPIMNGYESSLKIRELEKKYGLDKDNARSYIVGLSAHST